MYSAAGPGDLIGDSCPECGALLEPVVELVDLVGFRFVPPPEPWAEAIESLKAEAVALPRPDAWS
jgi:hypothetical protein